MAPILSITEHEANNNCIWVSDKTWNSLSRPGEGLGAGGGRRSVEERARDGAQARDGFGRAVKKLGVKVVEGVDKSGFMKAAPPIQDQLAKELGPHAVKILELVRNVK